MRRFIVLFALTTIPNLAFAGTPLDTWEKKVKSVARSTSDGDKRFTKPKALCVCITDVSTVDRRVGVLSMFRETTTATRLQAICTVPGFDESGEVISRFSCSDWLPFSK